MPNHSTCHAQSHDRVFCPGYPIRRQSKTAWTHTTSGPGCGRHMAAACMWINMHHTVYFHTGQQLRTSTDEGFFNHTCQCTGVSPQSNITAAASDYFYMHAIIRLHLTCKWQKMQQLHFWSLVIPKIFITCNTKHLRAVQTSLCIYDTNLSDPQIHVIIVTKICSWHKMSQQCLIEPCDIGLKAKSVWLTKIKCNVVGQNTDELNLTEQSPGLDSSQII